MINLIAATTLDFVIGRNGHLPWHIPEELAFFKTMTLNSVVIMGKNTYDSIGKPLPNRVNIVISKTMYNAYSFEEIERLGIKVVRTLDEAISLHSSQYNHLQCFVIGGQKVYTEAIERHLVDKIYLSIIYGKFEGDARFPQIDEHYIFTDSFNHNQQFYVRKYERRA